MKEILSLDGGGLPGKTECDTLKLRGRSLWPCWETTRGTGTDTEDDGRERRGIQGCA